jgi:hypothetical protein
LLNHVERPGVGGPLFDEGSTVLLYTPFSVTDCRDLTSVAYRDLLFLSGRTTSDLTLVVKFKSERAVGLLQ